MPPLHYIGCMTGTSVDGLDLALIELDDTIQIIAATSVDLPSTLRAQLLELGQPDSNKNLDDLGYADADLGDFIGHSVCEFMAQQNLQSKQVSGVGSHGQTVRHRPGHFTMQIGDPNRIAEVCGITTVADFRRRDVAAGGQGAPLVPPFHQALFGNQAGTVVLNIGGISNITVLGENLLGFDTGPGNGLMDSWYNHHHPNSQTQYDAGGVWASGGSSDQRLLRRMLEDPFFAQPPPKSTGREYFNLNWVEPLLENQSPADVQATLAQLTAESISNAIANLSHSHGTACHRLVVCGGGRLNAHLMQQLSRLSGEKYRVLPCEDLNIDGDSLEAAAFAWLAHQTLTQQPSNAPSVTGASGPRILGSIYPGAH